MTIMRYRNGSGTMVRLEDGPNHPYFSMRKRDDAEEGTTFRGDEGYIPSECFFRKERRTSRRDWTTPDALEEDTDELAADIVRELNDEGWYRTEHKMSRHSHHYVTTEYQYGVHGELFPLSCDYEDAARIEHEVSRTCSDFKYRGAPIGRSAWEDFKRKLNEPIDEDKPLREVLGDAFRPLCDERWVGIGKPRTVTGWTTDIDTGRLQRTTRTVYKQYEVRYYEAWLHDLGIEPEAVAVPEGCGVEEPENGGSAEA